MIRYPDIIVTLSGTDGNAFAIMGNVTRELRRNKVSNEEIEKFYEECTSGDYDNLLQTCLKWVNVE